MDYLDIKKAAMEDLCSGLELSRVLRASYAELQNSTQVKTNLDNRTALLTDANGTMYEIPHSINMTNSTFSLEEFCKGGLGVDFNLDIPEQVDSTLSSIQHYLTGIAALIVCVLGLMGNAMSFHVMTSKKYTKSSTYVYLAALAISDSFVLIFAMLINIKDVVTTENLVRSYTAYTFPYFHPLANTFPCISIWLTLGFTVDRYIMICHPFQGARFCNRRRAIIVVIIIYILGVSYNIPKFFEYKTIEEIIRGHKLVYFTHTKLGSSDTYLKVVHLWSYTICIFVLPCTTLVVLNTKLALAVKESRKAGHRMSLGICTASRNDTTIMLVGVVIVFLVCQMPALVSHTIWASMPDKFVFGGDYYYYFNIIQEIANFLVILNSAINILLYYAFSKKFRTSFGKLFCRRCVNASKSLVNDLSHRVMSRRPTGSSDLTVTMTVCPSQSSMDARSRRQSRNSFCLSPTVSQYNNRNSLSVPLHECHSAQMLMSKSESRSIAQIDKEKKAFLFIGNNNNSSCTDDEELERLNSEVPELTDKDL